MEGIHGMNPLLIPEIPATQVYKIYIWAQLMLSFENQNGISTTDNRLIRRMTRDYQFRGYSAKATLEHWPAVRKGEDRWIFPHRSHADVLFNSALKYELSALRRIAEPILQEVASNEAEYAEAQRLLELLLHFYPIDMECLPPTSLLREFVGKSAFHY
jgi:uridine kinase